VGLGLECDLADADPIPRRLRRCGYDITDFTSDPPDLIFANVGTAAGAGPHPRRSASNPRPGVDHTRQFYSHPWFQRAPLGAPGQQRRVNFYVWRDARPGLCRHARVLFRPTSKAFEWNGRRSGGQCLTCTVFSHATSPKLNYAIPRCRKEMLKVVDFWLDMGRRLSPRCLCPSCSRRRA